MLNPYDQLQFGVILELGMILPTFLNGHSIPYFL